MNGMSNNYWGWGQEDDDFRDAIRKFKLKVNRPNNATITTGRFDSFKHIHGGQRQRDMKRCEGQTFATRKREPGEGLSTTNYNVTDIKEMSVECGKFTVLSVDLKCDKKVTPWCDC